MPSGYYDLYAEAGSIFVLKLNFLDPNGVSATLMGQPKYLPEELKGIGWGHVTKITALLQVKSKPSATATGVALITFKSNWNELPGERTLVESQGIKTGDIAFIVSIDPATQDVISDHNIRIWITNPEVEIGTHFYDLELEFTGGPGVSGGTNKIKLRILQGRFTVTPQVSS